MLSGIAQVNIFPGAAVAQSDDSVTLAGIGTATHIALTGAPIKGVVTMESSGMVDLSDWTLATGSRYLQAGAVYYSGANGTLALSGTQAVGVASSKTALTVTIQAATAVQPQVSLTQVNSSIATNTADIITLSGFVAQNAAAVSSLTASFNSYVASSQAAINSLTLAVNNLQSKVDENLTLIGLLSKALQDEGIDIDDELEATIE